jgi:hypothetical protein
MGLTEFSFLKDSDPLWRAWRWTSTLWSTTSSGQSSNIAEIVVMIFSCLKNLPLRDRSTCILGDMKFVLAYSAKYGMASVSREGYEAPSRSSSATSANPEGPVMKVHNSVALYTVVL